MGKDISEKLEFVPAKVEVIQHVRPKYACRNCEKNNTSVDIKQAQCQRHQSLKGLRPQVYLLKLLRLNFNTVFHFIVKKRYFSNGVSLLDGERWRIG
ncbi:IS66 family transposase zinc-finger binding domain-containing protein [Aliivibrio salmonicida]|uniref:IS66 family transposase zinc-finger binding domain-containing protein n=1 Tax=Aliivibrio salmonicida TaxID=40269 RepID=UPI001F5D02B9|nr:IS66 family transposase zinc-finger binding domain-containing protein [Aliivibrio salmonicida]